MGDNDCDGVPNGEDPDVDGDGIPNGQDPDVDGDGIPNGEDPDVDGDGIPNGEDDDTDGDGIPNGEDPDVDGDGIPNGQDPDVDGDGLGNGEDPDVDGDGLGNGNDPDVDGDGESNSDDEDVDGDGIPNGEDEDRDGDGIPNGEDSTPDGCQTGDPCCGSADPCCNSNDPCCGNPDPCCNPDNPCCGTTATLIPNPSNVPAGSDWLLWPIMDWSVSEISVEWNPAECEGDLDILEVVGGYDPPTDGFLMQDAPTAWRYVAFAEPIWELHPTMVTARIVAIYDDAVVGATTILVQSIHDWLTHAHQHGPQGQQHQPDNADFTTDFQYLYWWKYSSVSFVGGPGFSEVIISDQDCVACPVFGCVYACTNVFSRTVTFGRSTFTGSENQSISIIGHELVHTAEGPFEGECTAYTWEWDRRFDTGIDQDAGYLQNVQQQQQQACSP